MTILRVSTQEAKAKLSEYLNRACYRGERFVIERHGKPVGAIVSPEDLSALERQSTLHPDAAYRQALADEGVVISRPTGTPIRAEERPLIRVQGKPLSHQIIQDRK